MGKNSITGLLLVGMTLFLGGIFYTGLPFHEVALGILLVSVLIMGFMPEKYVFLYFVCSILIFGGFLTVYAFTHMAELYHQIYYVYIHLLTTGFLLLYWILIHHLKKLGLENQALLARVRELEKYENNSMVLTLNEFMSKATLICNIAVRKKEELSLLELQVHPDHPMTEENLKETLSRIVMDSIRNEFDIVTIKGKTLYVLLQNTQKIGVEIVKKRIEHRAETAFHQSVGLFSFLDQEITGLEHLKSIVEAE